MAAPITELGRALATERDRLLLPVVERLNAHLIAIGRLFAPSVRARSGAKVPDLGRHVGILPGPYKGGQVRIPNAAVPPVQVRIPSPPPRGSSRPQ